MNPIFKVRKLNTQMINTDKSYQRDLRKTLVNEIAKNFKEKYFGAIIVSERSDGSYWVVDGQHRLEAAKRLGIPQIPCVVQDSESIEQEAEDFYTLSTARKPLTVCEKYKAAVKAGIHPQKTIDEWLYTIGMSVSSGGGSVNHISCINTVVTFWHKDEVAIKRAISFCQKIEHGSQRKLSIYGPMLVGAFNLIAGGIDVEKYTDKIISQGGRVAFIGILSNLNSVKAGNAGAEKSTMALLNMINYKKRNKLEMVPTVTSRKPDTSKYRF